MKSLYEPISRKLRATNLRTDARLNRIAGFRCLADVNDELADLLDPPAPDEDRRTERKERKRYTGPRTAGTQESPVVTSNARTAIPRPQPMQRAARGALRGAPVNQARIGRIARPAAGTR